MVVANEIIEMVMDALTTKDSEGNVTNFDFEGLKDVIKGLQENKKALSEVAKEKAKELKKQTDAENAELGFEYAKSLSQYDEISYRMADGSIITGKLVKISDKTATILLPSDSPLLVGKDTSRKNYDCRYVKFEKLVIPAEIASEMVA